MKSYQIPALDNLYKLSFTEILRHLEKLYKYSGEHFFHQKFDFKGICAYLKNGNLSSFEGIHRYGGSTTLSLKRGANMIVIDKS